MEQSTSAEDMHFLFNEDEIEVCRILLDLRSIITKSEFQECWPLTWTTEKRLVWGATKRRSSIYSRISVANPVSSSASPVPSVQKTSQNECEKKTGGQVKVEATSPSTPLAFSPSESDEKSKHCRRKSSRKRSREELLKTVKELTDNRVALRGELERVKTHYNEVLAYNRELKAMKKQVESSIICHKREDPQLEMNLSCHLGLSLGRSYQISLVPVVHHHRQQQPQPQPQQPSMVDPRAATELFLQTREQFHHPQYPYVHHQHQATNPLFSSNTGMGRVTRVGPLGGVPDLNVSFEESSRMDSFQPLDYSRAQALADQKAKYAEARRERQMKRKFKRLPK